MFLEWQNKKARLTLAIEGSSSGGELIERISHVVSSILSNFHATYFSVQRPIGHLSIARLSVAWLYK